MTVPIVPGRPPEAITLAAVMPVNPPPPKRGATIWLVVAGLVVAAGVGGGFGYLATRPRTTTPVAAVTSTPPPTFHTAAPVQPPATFPVAGLFSLYDDDAHFRVGKGCEGDGGFADIHVGTQVVVTAGGETVGLGELIGGTGAKVGSHVVCRWAFFIAAVTAGKRFYAVEISHRGQVQYSEADVQQDLVLTLGDN